MTKNWNKTYNQNGFNLENARKMELNAEDLMILRWFLDFYPLMERVCVDNKEYGWVHYGYLLHNLQIIYCKEESVAKRFHRYCELGLIEKTVKNTKQGRKVYFRAVENIILLYTSHTDKNLDAHTDKNLDAHTDKNLDNSSTIYPSTINSKKDTASGFSFQGSYSEIPNYSTNFNSLELHQIKKPAVKESLTIQKQDGQQNYILNTSKKNVAEKNADFNEFWNEWRVMCKAKGSPTGEKKPAEIEYQKAVKIANHQGIMRTLEAFKDFILLAFENNKHACRWLKNIHWSDFENVIADYKQQAEILKTNLKKQGKPLPIAQKSPEKQQEEVKMKEDIQNKLEAIKSRLNAKEKEFNDYIKSEVLPNYFSAFHFTVWINDMVIKCRAGVASVGVFNDISHQWQKLQPILTRELSSKGFEFEKIELKLID